MRVALGVSKSLQGPRILFYEVAGHLPKDSTVFDKKEEPGTPCLRAVRHGLWEHITYSFYSLPLRGSHN